MSSPNANDEAFSQENAQKRLDRFGPLMVKMRVYDVKTDEEIRTRVFNYNDLELRKWYGKTLVWALKNSHAIELVAVEADQ